MALPLGADHHKVALFVDDDDVVRVMDSEGNVKILKMGGTIEFIYVGTPSVDGIDTLLAANPHPYATGDTPGPIPFDNGTTDPSNPLAFAKLDEKLLLLFGAFEGVTIEQSIFTLPEDFTPEADQPALFLFSDFSAQAAANVQADSQVIYKGSSAIVFS